MHIFDNLYWGGDFEHLKLLIQSDGIKPSEIRFFVGYSGWSPKQLDKEIEKNFWLVTKIDDYKIMQANTDDIWKNILNNLGNEYKIWADAPVNPNLN